jgi:hypothetical protein
VREIDPFVNIIAPAGAYKLGDKVVSDGKEYWIAGQVARKDGSVQYWLSVETTPS